MRRMTKLLLALPLIAGTTLATLPTAEAYPGGWGHPGWGRPGWGGPRWGGPPHGYWGPRREWHRGPSGGAIAGALIGGLAVGALAGAALSSGPPPVAYAPPPPPPPPMGYAVPVVPVVPMAPVAPVAPGYYAPGGYYSGW